MYYLKICKTNKKFKKGKKKLKTFGFRFPPKNSSSKEGGPEGGGTHLEDYRGKPIRHGIPNVEMLPRKT